MRLFIAIVLDENMTDALAEMQDDLMREGIRGSYTRPENLHITLAFLGENDEPEKVIEVMRDVPLKSFSIKASGTRRFKDMVFANIEESQELHDYVKRLRKALSDEDIEYDRKKFIPHITLVRRATGNKDFPGQHEITTEESMRVKGISLMKSERGKHGMVYTEIGYVRAF
ncbi:RNA 2',3'-cyclic phosphodiesterase [Butyrivibrio sp. INlla16]|uniref:RNA 2',3'-cyclic phosphodiesterase n=1 Tax=Butyrivibrio sp. INlla16 TaxID=1520807 RepID=UPI00089193B5|nr:RNA 2',3'-cyclic phosphodiesterase [Butyrivibrio sp. INlla16]SDB64272.1 2'-5' RNA ligase [Butyrivibrio sp. INlla16]